MNNNQTQSQVVVKNFLWRFLERCASQGIAFVVQIILARKLSLDDYGDIALMTTLTAILQVFVDSGFGTALIQKKDSDQLDFSTVFYFNIIFSIALYIVMFLAAPWLAVKVYKKAHLTPIIRAVCLVVLVAGMRNVQQSYVSKNMQFRKFFYSTLIGNIGSGILSIVMVYMGYGIWSLVVHTVANVAISVIVLWFTTGWRPSLCFSFDRLGALFSYGWKLLTSSLIDTIYNNLRSLLIGVVYDSSQLAFYNKGKQFPHLIVTNVNASIDSVLLPTMSAQQDNKEAVRSMTRRSIRISTYVMMPLMMGLAVCARPLVHLLLTERWDGCVLFLQVFCFTYAFHPIHTANLNAIKAMGHSGYFLILEIIKKSIGIMAIFATLWISVEAMAYSLLVTTILSQIINSWPNRTLLNYSYWEQIKDMLPQIILSCVMGACVYCITLLKLSSWLTLLIQIPTGAVIYIGLSALFRLESFTYILNTLRRYIKKK